MRLGERWYVLDDQRRPVRCADLLAWARWFEANQGSRVVAREAVGEHVVSTVFLGIDHRWGKGPPLLFETVVFGPDDKAGEMDRYSSWDDAEAGHRAAIDRLKERM